MPQLEKRRLLLVTTVMFVRTNIRLSKRVAFLIRIVIYFQNTYYRKDYVIFQKKERGLGQNEGAHEGP